eukprot:15008278-Ditylum_brightwellii.AAC.1
MPGVPVQHNIVLSGLSWCVGVLGGSNFTAGCGFSLGAQEVLLLPLKYPLPMPKCCFRDVHFPLGLLSIGHIMC